MQLPLFFSTFLFCWFYAFSVSALIIEVAELESFKKEIVSLDSQALVVFDVDRTLIAPADPFFRYIRNPSLNCKKIQQGFGHVGCIFSALKHLKVTVGEGGIICFCDTVLPIAEKVQAIPVYAL